MYLSQITDEVNKKIDDILKWFLFSNKIEYEKIQKAPISLERLIIMKELGRVWNKEHSTTLEKLKM